MSSSSSESLPQGRDRVLAQLPAFVDLSERLQAAVAARAEGEADPEQEAEAVLRCFAQLRPDFAAYGEYVDALPATLALVAALRADRATHYALAVCVLGGRHA